LKKVNEHAAAHKIREDCLEVTGSTSGENSQRSQDINAEMMNALDAFLDKDTPISQEKGVLVFIGGSFLKPQL
jgi:dihydroxyacid dehydratase/phosphogluconate dehydratase